MSKPQGRGFIGKTVNIIREGVIVSAYIYRRGYGEYYNGQWSVGGQRCCGIVTFDEIAEGRREVEE